MATTAYSGENVIDEAIHDRLECEGVAYVAASNDELCRRLFVDLVGRYPTPDEVSGECAGKSADVIAASLQEWQEYTFVGRRLWRDRLDSSDLDINWRVIKDLFGVLDGLFDGSRTYEELAVEVLAHPGFLLMRDDPRDRAVLAFEVFLGRSPTEAEATDLTPLFRFWFRIGDADPDFPTYREMPALVPTLCSEVAPCRSELFGGAVDLTGIPTEVLPQGTEAAWWEDLTDEQRAPLREVGRMFVRQPMFWEAAADELLDRLLGWNDGGRFPRRPGAVLPRARAALAAFLAQSGDYRAAERQILASRLYTQTSAVSEAVAADAGEGGAADKPAPVYASGPVKPLSAEAWLDSAAQVAAEFGVCDSRYPYSFAFFLLYDAVEMGELPAEELESALRRLHAMMDHRVPLEINDDGDLTPRFLYQYLANQIGGCPNGERARQEVGALAFAFAQEALAELICLPDWADGLMPGDTDDASLEEVLDHQMPLLFGRGPTPDDLAAFQEAIIPCQFGTCSGPGMAQSVCVALLGSAQMLFY